MATNPIDFARNDRLDLRPWAMSRSRAHRSFTAREIEIAIISFIIGLIPGIIVYFWR